RPRRLLPVGGGRRRPGDDFDERAEWEDVLAPHGWVAVGECAGVTSWRRPGKSEGISATTGYCRSADGGDLLHVFTPNALPPECDHTYSKFGAYAVLEHGGDFRRAARHLRGLGYGGNGEW